MSRSWIVCATCRGVWPTQGTPTPYHSMQVESQPCPSCEAYTLSCVPVSREVVVEWDAPPRATSSAGETLAEVWRATEG
jgi:hypothetical protein